MNAAIILILFAITLQGTYGQSCSSVRPYEPEVCKFSGSLEGISGGIQSNACGVANNNPFDAAPFGSSGGQSIREACNAAVRSDGNNCEQFYLEYQCSGWCPACNEDICKKFCVNAPSTCPTADGLGCFGNKNFCADTNSGCVDWDVNINKLPSSSTTATTGTHTTTTTHSHTTTQTSAGNRVKPLSVAGLVLILAIAYIIA